MVKTVIFYDGGCADCQKVSSLLSATGVDYLRYNVKGHPELMSEVKRLGFKSLPTVIADNQVIEGWDETRLRNVLS
ncbi:MAG: glutaredoxin family protein [Candidatus Omnitrophica bacterium]|nr:glutaredoxin family protein [Candidatus Omnitrophota bacterium]